MKIRLIGILFGGIAGIIDVIPMIIMGLSWDANLAAFAMWIVIGFFIASTELQLNPILKGVLISYLVLSPSAILIGWKNASSLVPILIMTTILGGLLGFSIDRIQRRMHL